MRFFGINKVINCFSGAGTPTSSDVRAKESNVGSTQAAKHDAYAPPKEQDKKASTHQVPVGCLPGSGMQWKLSKEFEKFRKTAGHDVPKGDDQARKKVLAEKFRQLQKELEAELAARKGMKTTKQGEGIEEDAWFDAKSSFSDDESGIALSRTPSFHSAKASDALIDNADASVNSNDAESIQEFAINKLKKVPEQERLAWLRKTGADKAMRKTVAKASPEAIAAWGDVIQLLPKGARFAFLGKRDEKNNLDSIACSVFNNPEPGAMKAWGKLLELVPDLNQERSKLLFARMDHDAGTPALAILFERGDKQALDQYAELLDKHMHLGNDDIHHVLLACLPTLKTLTSSRGAVSGKDARDWVGGNGLKYANPIALFGMAEETAKAYGKLVRLVPEKYRNDVLFPEAIWTVSKIDGKGEGHRSALCKELPPYQARELAHSITLLKVMVPDMTAAERKRVLNEIRSRHAVKKMGIWTNTHRYEKFKKEWPAVDAMLLDLKAALKEA